MSSFSSASKKPAPDHTPQTSEIAFGAIDMDAIEKAVGVGMVDPLDIERARQQIPVILA